MKWTIALLALFSFSAAAEVTPDEVSSMLDQMVKENVISAAEAEKTRAKMKSMSKEQWSAINTTAKSIAARSPASVSENNIKEVNRIDLDGAQFKQIQEDIGKIVPKNHD